MHSMLSPKSRKFWAEVPFWLKSTYSQHLDCCPNINLQDFCLMGMQRGGAFVIDKVLPSDDQTHAHFFLRVHFDLNLLY